MDGNYFWWPPTTGTTPEPPLPKFCNHKCAECGFRYNHNKVDVCVDICKKCLRKYEVKK